MAAQSRTVTVTESPTPAAAPQSHTQIDPGYAAHAAARHAKVTAAATAAGASAGAAAAPSGAAKPIELQAGGSHSSYGVFKGTNAKFVTYAAAGAPPPTAEQATALGAHAVQVMQSAAAAGVSAKIFQNVERREFAGTELQGGEAVFEKPVASAAPAAGAGAAVDVKTTAAQVGAWVRGIADADEKDEFEQIAVLFEKQKVNGRTLLKTPTVALDLLKPLALPAGPLSHITDEIQTLAAAAKT